jgi:hypothetical protein
MNSECNSVQRVIGFDSHPDSFTAAILRGPRPPPRSSTKPSTKSPWPTGQPGPKSTPRPKTSSCWKLPATASRWCARWPRWVAKRSSWKAATWANSKKLTPTTTKSALCASAKPTWRHGQRSLGTRPENPGTPRLVPRPSQSPPTHHPTQKPNPVLFERQRRAPAQRNPLTNAKTAAAQIKAARDWSGPPMAGHRDSAGGFGTCRNPAQKLAQLDRPGSPPIPALLSLVRLCGIREMTAFALGAFIGDIRRFDSPKKLVKYADSTRPLTTAAKDEWSGGIGGHGNKHLRGLLIEGAHAILRCGTTRPSQVGQKTAGPQK